MNGWVTLRRLREWLGDETAALAPIAWNGSQGTFLYDLRSGASAPIRFFDRGLAPDEEGGMWDLTESIAELFRL